MTICNQCNGNHYINVREIWKDVSQTKKVWVTKLCPKCIPISEDDMLDDFVKKINKPLKVSIRKGE